MNLSAIILVTKLLYVCVTLAKTINTPASSTNIHSYPQTSTAIHDYPAQLLSIPATPIVSRRRRNARRIQANPVGGSSHPPRPEWWPLTEYWPPTAQEYGGNYITPDDIYREVNTVFRNGDGWPICAGMHIQVTRCATINLIITLLKSSKISIPTWESLGIPQYNSGIIPFLRPCDACHTRKANNRCVWSRSACKFKHPLKILKETRDPRVKVYTPEYTQG